MNRLIKTKAFSLIEVLLVIAIISVLATIGLSFANKYAERIKVQRTAFEIQQILEAGVEYYNANNAWPKQDQEGKITDEFKLYLPLAVESDLRLKNPWGNSYTFLGNNFKFIVRTAFNNTNIASQVEALLPNAYRENISSKMVSAETLVGNSLNEMPDKYINAIGSLTIDNSNLTSAIPLPNIPKCFAGKRSVVTVISGIKFGSVIISPMTFSPENIGVSSVNCPTDQDKPCTIYVKFFGLTCRMAGEFNICPPSTINLTEKSSILEGGQLHQTITDDGKMEIYYIAYCEK